MLQSGNLLIKKLTTTKLKKINEAELSSGYKKYKFSGCFTACSTPDHKLINKNGRIYMENEVLRHLSYLREKIRKDGSILGELDHPEGRFDVSLKEASHKITDLWYDQNSHCVMGTLELLDTPNGQIARQLVEAGYPLFVSSRAAGDVDPKTKEVEIATIFTYDIVCTPGFEEARLDRVEESLKSSTKSFLTESVKRYKKSVNEKAAFGVKEDEVFIKQMPEVYKLNENEIMSMNNRESLKDLTTPLNEETEAVIGNEAKPDQVGDKAAAAAGLEIRDLSPSANMATEAPKDDMTSKLTEEDNAKDESKEEKKKLILDITPEEETKEKKDASDILEIEAEHEDDSNDESKDDEKSEESSDDSAKEEKDVEEDAESESCEVCGKKAKAIKDKTDKDIEDVDKLLDTISKKKEVKEKVIEKYPFAISLSPSNFAKFMKLSESDKSIANDFIVTNGIMDVQAINETWTNAFDKKRNESKIWLRLASEDDINLFLAESLEVQNSIAESAKFFDIKTKADVEEFWNRTGLRQKRAAKINAYKMNEKYKEMFSPESYKEELGYSTGMAQALDEYLSNE